jgi:hypothetical protein
VLPIGAKVATTTACNAKHGPPVAELTLGIKPPTILALRVRPDLDTIVGRDAHRIDLA